VIFADDDARGDDELTLYALELVEHGASYADVAGVLRDLGFDLDADAVRERCWGVWADEAALGPIH
jgi:hypothetical protein